MIRNLLACLLGVVLLCTTAPAQEITADNVGTAIRKVYNLSQEADSVEEYTEIIELCEQITPLPVDAKQISYAKNLAAWAYNRRGESHAEQATALAAKGNDEQAAEFDALSLADFNRSVALDTTKWKAYHNRGVSNALAGNYDKALTDFSRSLELEPEYSNTWFNRGEIYFEQGEYAKAIADYNETLRLKPNDPGAISRRGRAYANSQQFAEAIKDFTRVLGLTPQHAETLVDRAEANASLQQWQQAAADYRQAIRLDQELGRAYRGAAWLMATTPVEQLRNNDLALQAARKAIELDGSTDYRYLDTLAAALASAGEYEQAVVQAKAAVEAAPAEQKAEVEQRLKQYEAQMPYRQS